MSFRERDPNDVGTDGLASPARASFRMSIDGRPVAEVYSIELAPPALAPNAKLNRAARRRGLRPTR